MSTHTFVELPQLSRVVEVWPINEAVAGFKVFIAFFGAAGVS